jgi:signal transduction histidine kinase
LRDIGYYVLYLGSVAVFMALARSVPALGGWTLASPRLESLISASIAASGVCLLLFARVFVELKEVLPKVDVAARVVIGIVALGGIGSLMGNLFPEFYWLRTVMLLVAGTHLGVVVIVAWLWRIGSRPARFFTAAFGCFFSATLPVIAMWFGRYTSEHPPMMFLMVGSALEMLLLSFATAERFAQAQREKEIAQQNLLEETEQRRAMQEAYADELTVEVRERTRELESANTDKDRMITILGHDLRGPLTSLTQTAGQLTAEPGNVARLQKFVADSAQTGREALLLIEDLLVWAQLRNGSPHPAGKHLVRALVAPVVTLHQALAGQRGVQLIVDVPEGLRISTDLVLAQTLLRNLVANALKFADARVELSAQATAEGVELCVRDDGPGLPAPVLAAVSGGEEMPVTAASGLGLRLCVDISRSLGTRLHVEVRDPQGTEFKFILSAVPGDRPLPLSSV